MVFFLLGGRPGRLNGAGAGRDKAERFMAARGKGSRSKTGKRGTGRRRRAA
jgi:hypothetical protein